MSEGDSVVLFRPCPGCKIQASMMPAARSSPFPEAAWEARSDTA